MTRTIDPPWLREPHLQSLLAALARNGHEARVVGGAVRNALLDLPAKDVDIATTRRPDDVIALGEAEGYRPVPTGIEHGTVTVVTPAGPYEVTTLRSDLETDGRHAVVAFGRDWRVDAERRDFTVNALYADATGSILDLVGGVEDLEKRLIRFIGDADCRIEEDALRILRFFRFHAQYGRGRPDTEGLKACSRHKDMLRSLSAERVWSELKRLLEAPDPHRTVLWMRQTGVLTTILPESERWGIDTLAPLIASERTFGLAPDPLRRLMSMVPPRPERMEELGERLRMSNDDRDRLADWSTLSLGPDDRTTGEEETAAALYRIGQRTYLDHALIAHARARPAEQDEIADRIVRARDWTRPIFPVRGRDLIERGHAAGPALGATLDRLESEWIASGFTLERDDLLSRVQAGP